MSRVVRKLAPLRPGVRATGFELPASKYDQFSERWLLVSVRQIPPNRRSVTGLLPSRKAARMVAFESTLERDLATLLEFDEAVVTFDAQPLELRYHHEGKTRRGFPDFLVEYRPDLRRPHMLCDVKFRHELFEKWSILKPRLKAARAYAKSQGWDYRILTEVEIRTVFLRNARFLLPYQRGAPDPEHEQFLMDRLKRLQTATPNILLAACYTDPWNRAQLVPTMWSLVGRGHICTDLEAPLTMESTIWCR